MCTNKELFDRYNPYDIADVVMVNGSKRKVIGMDTVKMKMFNRVVQTFSNVRHVFNLKKNLVSLNKLDALGYGFPIKNTFMKVGKYSLAIMKVKKIDNLYKLIRYLI